MTDSHTSRTQGMMTLGVALIALGLAATAAIFSIWPAVTEAPWESATVSPASESIAPTPAGPTEAETKQMRCEAALQLRETATAAYEGTESSLTLMGILDQLEAADEEIARFC